MAVSFMSAACMRHNWREHCRINGLGPNNRTPIKASIRKDVLSVGKCAHCEATERLSVDHIKPYSKGGSNRRRNLQCLCRSCNSRKGAR